MYKRSMIFFMAMIIGLTGIFAAAPASYSAENSFLGNWALRLPNDRAGWLSVREENGYLAADLLWGGGSVVPVMNVCQADDSLIVWRHQRTIPRERNDQGRVIRSSTIVNSIILNVYGDTIEGQVYTPRNNGKEMIEQDISGNRLLPPRPAPDLNRVEYGKPIKLFNGENLEGWKLINPNSVNGWRALNGILSNYPTQYKGENHIHYGNLRTEQTFKDFNLKMEVNVPKGSNSGVYLRGIYEVQISDSYGRETDSHNMGAIYSRITPNVSAEKPAGEWQKLDITLCKRHVNVILNGTTIIDNQPLLGCTGGALSPNVFEPGPIYLQGDHGEIHYRDIILTPIVE